MNIKKLFNAFSDDALTLAFSEVMARTSHDNEETNNPTTKFDFDEYTMDDNFNSANIETEFEEDSSREKVMFIAPEKLPESNFQELFEKLNQDQRNYIMHVGNHFENMPNKQLLHFLTGGAGVGKSLTITTLFQTLYRIFNSEANTDPDELKILLCAPTGKASFNIGGQTLHSAFKLPINTKQLNELSPAVSNTLATKLKALKVLMIDEISMVGQHTLHMVDQRLRHLFNKEKLFGGISVIAVGDFNQLRPYIMDSDAERRAAEVRAKRLQHLAEQTTASASAGQQPLLLDDDELPDVPVPVASSTLTATATMTASISSDLLAMLLLAVVPGHLSATFLEKQLLENRLLHWQQQSLRGLLMVNTSSTLRLASVPSL
ncbi:hypothetical protein FOCC_FOCC015418 [Frankliniella occidentalis]|nr:hypothetical protein FOCC_FOCC015418 [Frankliniella occidentalis]